MPNFSSNEIFEAPARLPASQEPPESIRGELRYDPLPRPEEVERWLKEAFLAGVRHGRETRRGGEPL